MFLTSCAEPGVRPPSPSNTKTFTSPAPASFRASASPAAGGMPCPDGPVLNFRNSVRPSISACPGSPPRRRSFSSHSQVRAHRPSSGKANSAAPVRSWRSRTASLSTASVAYTSGTVCPADSTNRSPNRRQGRSTSQRMAPDSSSASIMCTLDRDPPGCPLCR